MVVKDDKTTMYSSSTNEHRAVESAGRGERCRKQKARQRARYLEREVVDREEKFPNTSAASAFRDGDIRTLCFFCKDEAFCYCFSPCSENNSNILVEI